MSLMWGDKEKNFAWLTLTVALIISVIGWIFTAIEYLRVCGIICWVGWFLLTVKFAYDDCVGAEVFDR